MTRGDIVRLRPRTQGGHEQRGPRFAVVVQSDALQRLSTVVVAPTSTVARRAGWRPRIVINGTESRVLVEQVVAVDARFCTDVVGRLDVEDMWAVDDALSFVLGLD